MRMKKNIFLYLALIIPILMIAITSIGVRYYKVELYPKYNFLYALVTNRDEYVCIQHLNHKLFPDQYPKDTITPKQIKSCAKLNLFVYDVKKNTSSKINDNQIQNFILAAHSAPTSPDGFYIQQFCSLSVISGWFEDGGGEEKVCLRKDNYQKRLNISQSFNANHYQDVIFIGWILGNR